MLKIRRSHNRLIFNMIIPYLGKTSFILKRGPESESGLFCSVLYGNSDSQLLDHQWLSGVPDFFDRNKILSGGDLSHYQVPHCIRVFFYFVWFVFIHHNFQFHFELCTYCNILDIYLS